MIHKFRSVARWPEGVLGFSDNISTDKHYTREQAIAVCKLLEVEGFGGEGKIFPVKVWVESLKGVSPCPFCGGSFGQTPEFMFGCTNDDCPEHPRIHDAKQMFHPVGDDDMVEEFWQGILVKGGK